MKIFKRGRNYKLENSSLLTQCYGELNRIRLILSENSEVGKHIAEFDATHNFYVPFSDDLLNLVDYYDENSEEKVKNDKS